MNLRRQTRDKGSTKDKPKDEKFNRDKEKKMQADVKIKLRYKVMMKKSKKTKRENMLLIIKKVGPRRLYEKRVKNFSIHFGDKYS